MAGQGVATGDDLKFAKIGEVNRRRARFE